MLRSSSTPLLKEGQPCSPLAPHPSPLPPCRHRGAFLDHDRVECRSNRLLKAEPGIVPVAVCAKPCPFADLPHVELTTAVPIPSDFPCQHRGAVARIGTCDLCSLRGQPMTVYHCALHGQCTLHRLHSKVKACATCADRDMRAQRAEASGGRQPTVR